jgi:hypothetical protein
VNELVTNAAKYAQPNNSVRDVWLVVRLEGDAISVSVRDAGIGLPADFNLEKSKGLGMRIVTALARQLGATLTVQLRSPGSEFTLLVPFQSASQGQVAAITDPEAGYCSDPGAHLSRRCYDGGRTRPRRVMGISSVGNLGPEIECTPA